MLDPRFILLVHLGATLFMWGVICLIQIVHYPLFALVGQEAFGRYEVAHTRRITPVVGPAMLVEAATAALLVLARPSGVMPAQVWLGLGLLGVVWLSTLTLQIPRHAALVRGFDDAAHRALVRSNWVRTLAWTLRAGLVLWMAAGALGLG